jgi:tetratricopeptide (TPR) repeat protein
MSRQMSGRRFALRIRLSIAAAVAASVIAASAPAFAGPVQSLDARARAAEAKGKFDDATMLMQAAIVADPARAASYVALGDLYARHGDPHFAHKYYDQALYLDPTLPAALEGIGKADLALGDRKSAAAVLVRLKKSCPACGQTRALEAAIGALKDSEADAAPGSMDKK